MPIRAAVAAASLLVAGCFYSTVTIAPSTRPVQPTVEVGDMVEGRACHDYLFHVIPLKGDWSRYRVALNRALARSPGTTTLVDVSVETKRTNWVVGRTLCTIVQGRPVMVADEPTPPVTPGATVTASVPPIKIAPTRRKAASLPTPGPFVLDEDSPPPEKPLRTLDPDTLRTEVYAAAARVQIGLRACVAHLDFHGPTGAWLTVAPSGRIRAADILNVDYDGTPAGDCLRLMLKGLKIAPFDGETMPVRLDELPGLTPPFRLRE